MTDPEGRAGLARRLAKAECICTDADDPNDHRPDCPEWRRGNRSDEDERRPLSITEEAMQTAMYGRTRADS